MFFGLQHFYILYHVFYSEEKKAWNQYYRLEMLFKYRHYGSSCLLSFMCVCVCICNSLLHIIFIMPLIRPSHITHCSPIMVSLSCSWFNITTSHQWVDQWWREIEWYYPGYLDCCQMCVSLCASLPNVWEIASISTAANCLHFFLNECSKRTVTALN